MTKPIANTLILIFILSLAACLSPQERYQLEQSEREQRESEMNAQMDYAGQQCERMGYAKYTNPYNNCVALAVGRQSIEDAQKKYEQQKRSNCMFAMSAGYAQPTLGGFAASQANATQAYNDCMAK